MATIVIVEDDELVQEIVARALESAAHTVIPVADGLDAIDCLWENDPDLIILDCALPGKGGLPILQELRASPRFQAIPVLMLTARRSDWHARLAMDAGASAYLRKPFKVEDLLRTVGELLQKADAVQPIVDRSGAEAEPLIDIDYLSTLRSSLGLHDTHVLLGMMADTLDQSIQTLVQALEAGDRTRVAQEAHALAGAATTVGAARLAEMCRTIERAPDDRSDRSNQLAATGRATREAIESVLSEDAAVSLSDPLS